MCTKPAKRKKTFQVLKISPYFLALLVGGLLSFHLTEHYYTSSFSHKIPRGEEKAIRLFFSPKGKCAEHIINTINQAEEEIYIAIFAFAHLGIADALIAAKERGVKIHILADDRQLNANWCKLAKLHKHNIDIYIDTRAGVFHHKWLAVDKKIIITGSYNYSENAEKNNNEIIGHIESRAVVEQYYQDWHTHIQHPKVYPYGDLRTK